MPSPATAAPAWRWHGQSSRSVKARRAWTTSRPFWSDGGGGQFGAQIAFSPDSNHLFLAVGDRQRMTPAQDPNQPLGKILRLTLDGAPGNPMAGKVGAATVPVIDPPADTEKAKTGDPDLCVRGPEHDAG
jgi:glucose/sorbosone dehydrogenase